MGQDITFTRPDGATANGYLATARAGAPGVVVISEWWGLQQQIRGVCDRYAAAGYNALAPDLYGGKVVPYHDIAGADQAMNALDFVEATDQFVRGAAQHLAAGGGKVGLTGYCMGGAITVIGAVRVPELAAAVSYYGIPPAEIADPRDIRVPFQGHFANRDDWCTPAVVDAFEAALKAAGKTYEIYRYEAAHAFANEERPDVYDPEAAALAWQRTLDFWARYLA